MEYWEMDFEKVNEFNFLNEEVEEFTSSWSQSLVNIRSPSYLGQKTFDYCSWGINILYFQFFIRNSDMLLVWVKHMVKNIHIHICIKFLMHEKLMW